MEIPQIIEMLKEIKADAWEIEECVNESWQFYFIRHALDQNRLVRTTHTIVRVYREMEDGKLLGSASEEIPKTARPDEVRKILDSLMERASYVKNPFYTLNPPSKESGRESADSPGCDAASTAAAFLKMMESVSEDEEAYLNSYEIFTNVKTVRFVNSRGVEKEATYPDSMLEVVVNAGNKEHEIELCRIFTMGTCDEKALKESVEEVMRIGRDRLRARPMPDLKKIPVLFTSSDARELCGFFTQRLDAAFKKKGYTDWEIGRSIFGGEMETKVTVETLKKLPNSSCNRAFDMEGALRSDAVMMKDSVPLKFLGKRQFSCYLGLKDSFVPGNYRISGGLHTEEELRSGDYLEAVEFSDFQTDALSGNLAGEIRLAYWHHDGEVIPVTGGSISATMMEAAKTMKMSRNLKQYDNMEIPAVIRLEDISVTGA